MLFMCPKCKKEKPDVMFWVGNKVKRFTSWCLDCRSGRGTDYKEYKHKKGLITKLLDLQDNKCAICKRDFFEIKSKNKTIYNLDHDHRTGMIRGLLCFNCNVGLGAFQDSLETMQHAIYYLSYNTELNIEKNSLVNIKEKISYTLTQV